MGAAEEELKEEEREEDGVVAREEDVVRVSAAEEEDVDVSPNGNSLASLARTPRDLALRFKNMYVYDNSFSVLPEGLRLYKELRKLKYWSNDVKVLPDEIGDLTQLEEVYLKFSAPSGLASLPPLAKLRGLRALELHQAPVLPSSATLTRDIAQLRSLSKLSVCHFSISWIPAEIGSLKNLEELDLSFNKLRALPKEIAGLRALKSLRVASNKLVELPSELSELPNLTSIDVAHNRLTSFENLGLESMSSLRALNAQFNKLQTIGQIPDWVCCQLEGNAMLEATIYGVEAENISCEDDYPQDCEVSPTSLVVKVNEPLCLSTKGNSPNQKVSINLKSRRGWRKQENQQYKARQDRLNNSRKHRNDDFSVSNEEVLVRKAKTNLSVEVDELPCETACADENIMDLQQPSDSECDVVGTGRDGCGEMTRNSAPAKQELNSRIHSEDSSCFDESNSNSGKLGGGSSGGKADSLAEPKDEGYHSDLDRRNLKDKNRSRKAISGDRSSVNDDDKSSVDSEGGMGKVTNSGVSVTSVGVKDEERLRRSGSGTEENPHPSKRRRSRPGFSEISYKYYTESFCGFSERLLDGFYDAGRDRPFSSLEDLEKEQPSFNSREVILVDRKRDEDLHDIALSAEQLLGRLGSPLTKSGEEKRRNVTMDTFQRITVLALFVSDCFGGSDKTLNVRNMRRTAFGGTAGTPFVCSCSSSLSLGSANAFADGGLGSPPGAALPSVHSLCEDAVKYLKAQRGSNVLPLGSLRFGVCRHRAILLKYLCDRADPVIPCELVRGYLDYMPHAWNVILVEDDKSSVRVLVDACRPLDIRHESDPEYFCRYIPLKRLLFPSASVGDQLSSKSVSSLVLFEKIGQGASGASVHRCKFGELTAAAKVRQLDGVAEGLSGKGPESSSLSELRIFCSLGKHPCLVSLYGHQFASQLDSGSQLIIYMEHVRGGSLEGVIKDLVRDGKEFMPPRLACQVARNIACALGMLHSKGILHRDVKSSNVLVDLDSRQGLDGGPVVKLCDFDRAVPLSSSAAHTCYLAHRGVPPLDVCVGTPRWFAPEVLQAMYERHAYGLEADVWSFGCLVAELLTLRVPYAGYQDSEVISSIRMGQRPRISAELENLLAQPFSDKKQRADDDTEILRVLVELFRSCTEANPSHRPTMKEVFEKLSEVSRTTSTSVDPPFEKDAGDESSNAEAVEPDVLKPLAEGAVQAADEAELPCSCGGKKCSQCESNGAQEAEST